MVKPRIEEVRRVAQTGNYNIMPVSMEMLSDIKTPVEVMRILLNISQHCYMLESAENNENWGRYTFLGYSPKMDITCVNGEIKVDGLTIQTGHPGKYIRQILENYRSPVMEDLPTFTGGLVGYFSYDYLKYSEPSLHLDAEDTEGFKDVDLMLFDKVIAFDHFSQKIILIVNISLDNIEVEYNRAQIELKQMADLIKNGKPKQNLSGRLTSEIRTLFSKEEYLSLIHI